MNKNSKQGDETRAKIMAFLKANQIMICPVSFEEIAIAVGVGSVSVVAHHLEILEKQNLIKKPAKTARHIEIVQTQETEGEGPIMKNKLPELSEHQIQAGFFREASHKYRNDQTFRPALFYAVLNGAWIGGSGSRAKSALIEKYKNEGWRSGIADMHYDQPRGPFSKLVIEFKRESKRNTGIRSGNITGGLESEQIEYLQAIAPYAMIAVCYSEAEAMAVFDYYMLLGVSKSDYVHELETEPVSVSAILNVAKNILVEKELNSFVV